MIEKFVHLLNYIVAAFGIVCAAMLIGIIVHKIYIERRKKSLNELRKMYRDSIYNGLKPAEFPSRHIEFEALSDVAIDMLVDKSELKVLLLDTFICKYPYSSECMMSRDDLRQFIKDHAVVEYYMKRASSRLWLNRFDAVERLGFFRLPDLRDFFRGIIETDDRFEVRAKALWALSVIADEDAFRSILRFLAAPDISLSSKFNEFIFANAVYALRKIGRIDIIVDHLRALREDDKIPVGLKKDLVEACGSADLRESRTVIAEYLSAYKEDVKMKLSCIRALGRILHPDDDENILVLDSASDEDWRVRATAVKSLKRADEKELTHLRKSLYDRNYVVRINAARALLKLGPQGVSILKSETGSQDKFVQDTVNYTLAYVRD